MATVIVRGGPSGFTQEIDAGRHRLQADEPEPVEVHRTLTSEINIRTRLVA